MPTQAHIPEWYTYKAGASVRPPAFSRSGKSPRLHRIPGFGAPSCSALEPAATIDFLRDPLAFHWAIPSAFSIFARSFLRLRWGLACPKGDYAWRNMTWQLLAAGPAVMSRRFAPANSA